MRYKIVVLVVSIFVFSCQTEKESSERAMSEIKATSDNISNAAIVRNPVTASTPLDTINVAKMEFDNIRHRYGKVEAGTIVTHTYKFKNVGKAPLIISNAKSTCGCTVPEWPKAPIAVGESGAIFVKFDTKNKDLYQTKPIFITANTHPSETTLYLMGEVYKKQSAVDNMHSAN